MPYGGVFQTRAGCASRGSLHPPEVVPTQYVCARRPLDTAIRHATQPGTTTDGSRLYCRLLATILVLATTTAASAGSQHQLRRKPYLTDLLQRHVIVNWATTAAVSNAWLRYGKVRSGNCTTHRAEALRKTIVVGTTREHQWRGSLDGLNPNTRYCYRIYGDGVSLLGHGRAPRFRTQVKHGGTAPFSFAVLGDWGAVDSNGQNPDQAAVLHQIVQSPARFVVTTGDTAYPNGSQQNYGDLVQRGRDTSAVFGPSFWAQAGSSIALFNAQGNHGLNATGLVNWPQPRAVSSSKGRYRMHRYCCVNHTDPAYYPTAWYAFDAGRARFYVLQAAWPNGNNGTADMYRNDHDVHWTTSSARCDGSGTICGHITVRSRSRSSISRCMPTRRPRDQTRGFKATGNSRRCSGDMASTSSSMATHTSTSATPHLRRECRSAM